MNQAAEDPDAPAATMELYNAEALARFLIRGGSSTSHLGFTPFIIDGYEGRMAAR